MKLQIVLTNAQHAKPTEGVEVLAWHSGGVDRAILYGDVWRLADGGEDQLQDVSYWATIPDIDAAVSIDHPEVVRILRGDFTPLEELDAARSLIRSLEKTANKLEDENERLRLENVRLTVEIETLQIERLKSLYNRSQKV